MKAQVTFVSFYRVHNGYHVTIDRVNRERWTCTTRTRVIDYNRANTLVLAVDKLNRAHEIAVHPAVIGWNAIHYSFYSYMEHRNEYTEIDRKGANCDF